MGPYAVSETLQSFLLEHLPLFTPHFYPWSCTIHYAHLSRWCREVVRWEKTKWGGPCASYCMSRSSLAKGQHTASHPHMADFLEDLDSLFLKTSTPQAIAWDTCLAASTRPSKAALKMKNCALSSESTASLQVLKTRRQANLWDSAGNSWFSVHSLLRFLLTANRQTHSTEVHETHCPYLQNILQLFQNSMDLLL